MNERARRYTICHKKERKDWLRQSGFTQNQRVSVRCGLQSSNQSEHNNASVPCRQTVDRMHTIYCSWATFVDLIIMALLQ